LFFFRTQLSSNYIRIKLEEDKGIYEYRVDFHPPVDAKSARFFLVNEHRDKFPVKTFDGTLLYLPKLLPDKVIIIKICNLKHLNKNIKFLLLGNNISGKIKR
jgi:hypothetical protein